MLDFLLQNPDSIFKILYSIFLFIIGASVGSFANVCIDRLPRNKSVRGRSHCDHCKKKLKFGDLIPILSYIFLRGRCRYCKKRIPLRYLLLEIVTGLMFVLTWFFVPAKTEYVKIFYLGVIASLIVILFSDLKYQIIPDEAQLSFFIFSLLIALSNSSFSIDFLFRKVIDGFWIMLPILVLFLVTRGRGMGFGDVKYAFIMGFFLKLTGGIVVLYLAFVIGALVGIALLIFKLKKLKSRIAFGPFLVLGTLLVMFFPGVVYYQYFYIINSWTNFFK